MASVYVALNVVYGYGTDNGIALIGCDDCEKCEDYSEIIMKDSEIYLILDKDKLL